MNKNKNMEFGEYVVVGAGIFGSVLAERIAVELGKRVTVIEKRPYAGGCCYSETDADTGIECHKYGTHIFHTSNPEVWQYVNRFAAFNGYRHRVLASHKGKIYRMPINLDTINSFYNTNFSPSEAGRFLKSEAAKSGPHPCPSDPSNFEEKALSAIGKPLYEAFFKGYTQKQWQKEPKNLPASIFERIPIRVNYDDNYFFDLWQGVPESGYAAMFNKLLSHGNIRLYTGVDFFDIRNDLPPEATLIYTGRIDQYFDFCYGSLEWRGLRFEKETIAESDYQGTAVVNYTDLDVPFTRIHEPRHLHPERKYPADKTLIIREYPADNGAYYPIDDSANRLLYGTYTLLAQNQKNVYFGGRLGGYRYMDMHHTVAAALELFGRIKNGKG
jgi:UDP-galactopyranose mutase